MKSKLFIITSLLLASSNSAMAQFVTPIGGQAYKDWTIVNYVDSSPGPSVSDYLGGNYSYDGHTGIDFTLPNFTAMDRGIPVYAASAGTITEVHDGEFDRCSRVHSCNSNANYVVIDHGNGLQTKYWHLAKNSIQVAIGQKVNAGETIALVGSSGNSSDAHLHFEALKNNQVIDTYQDPYLWWKAPLPYAGTQKGVLDFGVTNHIPSWAELVDRPADQISFSTSGKESSFFWINLFGTKPGEHLNFTWFDPDGQIARNWYWNSPEIRYGWWIAGIDIPERTKAGIWSVKFDVGGEVLASATYSVSPVPEPPISAMFLSGVILFAARPRKLLAQLYALRRPGRNCQVSS